MRFLLHLLLLFQIRGPRLLIFLEPPMVNPLNHKHYKVKVNTDARLAQGWTTD
ncbi:unnamed protein product, partial [Brassica rapa subsp. trilocularis]